MTPPDASARSPHPARSPRLLLWLVAIGFFMQTLDATIVNTALPAMADSLGESPLRMQSVVIAYALTMAMLIPASGWLADRFGTRPTFIGAIALFVAGSLLCALSPNLSLLVAARVVQGLGGALLLPVGRLAVLRTFPGEKFLPAMSFVTIPGLIGPLLGPPLGGWLSEAVSWHWIFLINVPVGLVGFVATLAVMPDIRGRSPDRFDLAGYLLLALGMVLISLALDGVSELGLRRATVLLMLVAGFAALAAYWLRAARHPQPLFPPRLFHVPTFSVGLLGNLFARLGSGSMPYLIPLLLQVNLGFSPSESGLMMIPVAAAGIFTKRLITPLIQYYGYRRILVSNTFLLGLAMASFAWIAPGEPTWLRFLQLVFFGMVNSAQFTAMNTVTLKDLDSTLASGGNSLLSMVMMLSMSMGVASAGAILDIFSDLLATGGPGTAQPAFQATFVTMGLMTTLSAAIFWQLAPATPHRPGDRAAAADLE